MWIKTLEYNNTTQHNATQRNATQRNAMQCNAMQYNTIHVQYHLFKHDGRNAAATYANVVVYFH